MTSAIIVNVNHKYLRIERDLTVPLLGSGPPGRSDMSAAGVGGVDVALALTSD